MAVTLLCQKCERNNNFIAYTEDFFALNNMRKYFFRNNTVKLRLKKNKIAPKYPQH